MAMFGAITYLPDLPAGGQRRLGQQLGPAARPPHGRHADRLDHRRPDHHPHRPLPALPDRRHGGRDPSACTCCRRSTPGRSRLESGVYMVVLGAGIGMVMQILVLAVQNEAPVEDLGVATSTVTFFRAVGGSVGVALFGALFSSRLGDLLGGRRPRGPDPRGDRAAAPRRKRRTAGRRLRRRPSRWCSSTPCRCSWSGSWLTWLLQERAAPHHVRRGRSETADRPPRDRSTAPPVVGAATPLDAAGTTRLDAAAGRGRRHRRSCAGDRGSRDGLMAVTDGLRERKKAETRRALSSAALRLARAARPRPGHDRGDRRGRGRVAPHVLQLLPVQGRRHRRRRPGRGVRAAPRPGRRSPTTPPRSTALRAMALAAAARLEANGRRPVATRHQLTQEHPSLAARARTRRSPRSSAAWPTRSPAAPGATSTATPTRRSSSRPPAARSKAAVSVWQERGRRDPLADLLDEAFADDRPGLRPAASVAVTTALTAAESGRRDAVAPRRASTR